MPNYFVTNLFRILLTKYYQNRRRFVEEMTKNILAYFFLGHRVVTHLDVHIIFEIYGQR